jgi:DNA-binding NtrC family response regulator
MPAFLILDGDRNFRDALAIALRLDGHLALATGDPAYARAQLAARAFDCCIVDAHLAGADALLESAASAGLRAFATGPYPELLAASTRRHPHAEALAKPFRPSDLAARVRAPTPHGPATRIPGL